MPSLNETMMLAFEDELEKQAISLAGLGQAARTVGGYLGRQGTTAGAGAALGAVGGAGIGAGIGGVKGYREAKRQGATTGRALLYAGLKGLKGGAIGGAAGGALGGAAGLASGAHGRALADKLRRSEGMLGGLSRAGEREMHGLTGALPHTAEGGLVGGGRTSALHSIDLGADPAMQRLVTAKAQMRGSWKGRDPKEIESLAKEVSGARKHLAAAQDVERLGATSVPGYIKALATKPMETISAGARQQWHSGGPIGKTLMVGFPAMGMYSAMKGPDEREGTTRGQRIGGALGSAAYGVLPVAPFLGVSALGGLATAAGSAMGRGLDPVKMKTGSAHPFRRKPMTIGLLPPPGPEPEEADVYSPAVEHEHSDSALGNPPTEGEVR